MLTKRNEVQNERMPNRHERKQSKPGSGRGGYLSERPQLTALAPKNTFLA